MNLCLAAPLARAIARGFAPKVKKRSKRKLAYCKTLAVSKPGQKDIAQLPQAHKFAEDSCKLHIFAPTLPSRSATLALIPQAAK